MTEKTKKLRDIKWCAHALAVGAVLTTSVTIWESTIRYDAHRVRMCGKVE